MPPFEAQLTSHIRTAQRKITFVISLMNRNSTHISKTVTATFVTKRNILITIIQCVTYLKIRKRKASLQVKWFLLWGTRNEIILLLFQALLLAKLMYVRPSYCN